MPTDDELLSALSDVDSDTPKKAERRVVRVTKATDEECAATAEKLMTDYPGLVLPKKHWTLTLISIINKTGYAPPRTLWVSSGGIVGVSDLDAMTIVQKHLSKPMLDDLEKHVKEWVATNPIPAAVSEEVILDGDTLAYASESDAKVEHAESEKNDNWCSW